MIPTHEQLEELKKVDIRTADISTLVDMSDYVFDNTLSQAERAIRLLTKIKNPYLFRLGDMAVKLEFAENGKPLQDVIVAFLLRQKCGL